MGYNIYIYNKIIKTQYWKVLNQSWMEWYHHSFEPLNAQETNKVVACGFQRYISQRKKNFIAFFSLAPCHSKVLHCLE